MIGYRAVQPMGSTSLRGYSNSTAGAIAAPGASSCKSFCRNRGVRYDFTADVNADAAQGVAPDAAAGHPTRRIRRQRVSLYAGGLLNVAFTTDQWDAIEWAAEALDLPMVEVVRRAVEAGLPQLRDAERKRRRRPARN